MIVILKPLIDHAFELFERLSLMDQRFRLYFHPTPQRFNLGISPGSMLGKGDSHGILNPELSEPGIARKDRILIVMYDDP